VVQVHPGPPFKSCPARRHGTVTAGGYIALRSAFPPEQITQVLRTAITEIDPLLALQQVQPMDDAISNIEAPRRFNTALITAFAVAALVLAITGVLCGRGFLRVAAQSGNRRPNGSRRSARRYSMACPHFGREAGALGMRPRCAWLASRVASRQLISFRCQRDRPTRLHGSGLGHDADGASRIDPPRSSCRFRGPNRCSSLDLEAHPLARNGRSIARSAPNRFRLVGKNEAACAADATREVVERWLPKC
jgi:hypothetical protein